jgi:hypothetical protein
MENQQGVFRDFHMIGDLGLNRNGHQRFISIQDAKLAFYPVDATLVQ